ncbi:SMI1/KNR4 family protein [Dictyobacter formicarum]|uniref:Knr4/Smi1-like domain-containing protein n=1 Tax=Dictyobacter formicarum TaxID=2778368 RepID=A0ABQ3VUI5_9CHLR|nr:SMI1/KNR4 family protein [Dictyobacter formicarum]GHO89406.1 hypothetical protein KSZ_74120 [Dictyobacter formicarum]
MAPSLDRLNLIKEKLKSLKRQDTQFQTFGASEHTYELHPPLTPDEVSAFEQQHAIILPEDYRNFLLSIGNGGAGPYYGLFPIHMYNWELENVQDNFLALPFPHQKAWQPDSDVIDTEAVDENHTYFGNYWIQGAMRICHFGCGVYLLLVVTGPERGNIWFDDRASDNGIYPAESNFLTWYETWLEDSLQNVKPKKETRPKKRSILLRLLSSSLFQLGRR